ncbi:MAG: ABC transporter substrate-binding protein [Aequorivita antarctica]
MKKYSLIILGLVVIALGVLIYLSLKKEEEGIGDLTKVRVQLQWFDGAQFTGLYVAKEKGYFKKYGLDVELMSGSYAIDPFEIISAGKADIGMATGDRVLIEFAEKRNIKVFGTVFNESTACFMAIEGKVNSLNDFKGKKIGIYSNYDTENILRALLQKHDISTNKVEIVEAGDVTAFKKGEIDLFPSYVFNEPISMQIEGINTKLFRPSDYGINFYSDTYFSTGKYYKENKNIIKDFLKASAEGWKYTETNQKEAIKIMIELNKNMTYNENHYKEEKSLEEIIKYLGDGNHNQIYYMQKTRWEDMENSLYNIGKINSKGNIDDLCDFEIINK